MSNILSKFFEIIIETIVITPIVFITIFLLLLACIFYPIKKINNWLIRQIRRIVDIWVYYIENAYMYED